MSSPDPFHTPSTWRVLLPAALFLAMLGVVVLVGVVEPEGLSGRAERLRATVLQDYYQLEHAVDSYVRDTHALPTSTFDLSAGSPGPLSDRQLVPLPQQAAWHGPYLETGLSHPTGASFWSLVDPCLKEDADHDGESDEVWGRLHRGYGEIDDATAQWLDQVLDDGDGACGTVRVTDTWIWFQLLELAHPAGAGQPADAQQTAGAELPASR
jgi:hypothetical protein